MNQSPKLKTIAQISKPTTQLSYSSNQDSKRRKKVISAKTSSDVGMAKSDLRDII